MVSASNAVRNGPRRSWSSIAIGAAFFVLSSIPANATSILADGTFQDSIGTGLNLTPWSDWTGAGISAHQAPAGIPENYASMPNSPNGGSDLYQRFYGAPGSYALSFFVQNASPTPAELVLSVDHIFGGAPIEFLMVLSLSASTDFMQEAIPVTLTQPITTQRDFYFSNSYDAPDPGLGLQNSVNPPGTVINVADVSLVEVPLPSTLLLMIPGLLWLGLASDRSQRKRATA